MSSRVLVFIALLCCFAGLPLAATAAENKPPNIVIILADDLGYGDLKPFNADSKIDTPHLEQLAEEGMRFTDAHSCGAVCHISRYALITGRYPMRMESHDWRNRTLIDDGRMTLPGMLSEHGYQTGMVGKWHLGFEEGHVPPVKPVQHGGPVDRGFGSYFGIPASLDQPPYYYVKNRDVVALPTEHVEASDSNDLGWTPIQGAFWRAGGVAPGFKHDQTLPEFTNQASDWIHNYAKTRTGKPFFLYVSLTAPHTPWLPLEKFQGKSNAGMYGDFTMQVDDTVGQILSTLKEHQFDDNTLVIFTSDNGPTWYDQDTERFGHDSAGPYRGMKGDAWEAGHRVPMLVRWPGHVPAGTESGQLQCHADFLATCADLIDQPLSKTAEVDSRSMLLDWLGMQTDFDPRTTFVAQSSGKVLALRRGNWKYIAHRGSGGFSKPRTIKPQPGEPVGQLYNITQDPGETNNLWNQHPEIVKEMRAELEKIKAEVK